MDAEFDSSFSSLRRLIVSYKVRVAENDASAASTLSAAVSEAARALLVSRSALAHPDVAAFLEADFAPPSIAMLLAIRRACETAVAPPVWMSPLGGASLPPNPTPPYALNDAGAVLAALDDGAESLIAGSSNGGSVGAGVDKIVADEADDASFVTALSTTSLPEWPSLTAAPLLPYFPAGSPEGDSVRDTLGDGYAAGANERGADEDYARVIYGVEYGVPVRNVCEEDDDGASAIDENGGTSYAEDEEFIETAPRVTATNGVNDFCDCDGGGGGGSIVGSPSYTASSPAILHSSARSPTLETPHERSRPSFLNAVVEPVLVGQRAATASAGYVSQASVLDEGGGQSPAVDATTPTADEAWIATARVAHDRIRALALALATGSAEVPRGAEVRPILQGSAEIPSGVAVRPILPQSRRRSVPPRVASAPTAPPRVAHNVAPRVALVSHGQAHSSSSSSGALLACQAGPAPAPAPLAIDPEAARARARAVARVKAVRSKEVTERERLAADAQAAAAMRYSERDKRIAAFVERHRTGAPTSVADGVPLRASSPPHATWPAPLQYSTDAQTTRLVPAHATAADADSDLNLSLGDLLPPDVA